VNVSALNWIVLVLAVFAANVPFFNQKLFALFSVNTEPAYRKPFWLRLIEWGVLYLIVGVIAQFLEGHVSNIFAQTWEFYAITVCLFVVFAYPGFVYRYLRKSSKIN
jgi:hypothetical protein